MASKNISYRRIERLRTRQRDSAGFNTAERVYTKTGMNGGSLGVTYTDTAPAGALDGFPDKITKTNRAQSHKASHIMRPSTVVDHSARLSYSGASNPRISKSAPPAVKATFNTAVNKSPVFTSSATVNAAENQTDVITVTATDAGGGVALTYSLTGGADQAKFSITSGGILTFQSAPDYEIPTDVGGNNVYEVEVTATDGIASTVQAISVTVTDVAENVAPVITSNGGLATASISIAENTTTVTTVVATDADGDTITYGIAAGTGTGNEDSALFSINTSTGVLTFSSAPDFETKLDHNTDNVYNVIVTAQDPSAAEDTQTLSITVTDVAEGDMGATGSIGIAGTAEGGTAS